MHGNALGLDSDDLVFEKSADAHTAAFLANVAGTPLCIVEVAGAFGRDLAAQGEAAMVEFAADWLAGLYGADVKKAIKRSHATRWNSEPVDARRVLGRGAGRPGRAPHLMEPMNDAIWFAGEAAHETLWGTVGGAWESGERAADAVLRRLGGQKEPPPAEAEAAPKHKAKRRRAAREEERGFLGTPRIFRDGSR